MTCPFDGRAGGSAADHWHLSLGGSLALFLLDAQKPASSQTAMQPTSATPALSLSGLVLVFPSPGSAWFSCPHESSPRAPVDGGRSMVLPWSHWRSSFRLSLVAEFRASAGDGIHYHQLAQQLRHAHRFALRTTAAAAHLDPLARVSGVFGDAVAVYPVDLPQHLVIATRANAVLDVGTAGLVAVMAWLLGWDGLRRCVALLRRFFMPPLFMLASHGFVRIADDLAPDAGLLLCIGNPSGCATVFLCAGGGDFPGTCAVGEA